jgi:4-hydroxybenzoate-CoA ligase
MAGLVPAIHVLLAEQQAWMPGTSPGMTAHGGLMTGPLAPMLEDLLQRRSYNAATDFLDANIDRGLGRKIAFTDGGRCLTYGDLQDASYRFGSALRALGLREENRVILILHDSVDYPVAFWGTIRAGIIPIPVNTLLTAEQYAYLFADSRAVATVVAAPLALTVLSIRSRLPDLAW